MTRTVLAAASLVALLGWSGVVAARTTDAARQAVDAPSGHWEGAIQVPGQELKIEVDLERTGDRWEGTINIPAQGLKGFPLSAITVKGDAVTFAMKGPPGDPQFSGTISKDRKVLSGDFQQGGGTVPFSLAHAGAAKVIRPPASTAITADLEGSWDGTVEINGKSLRLMLKLANQPKGPATGTLVSVDQGGAEIPIATIVQEGSRLTLLLPTIGGSYKGDLKSGVLSGTWAQGPGSWPLTFTRK